ncbi:unnamed protein product, partial [Sphacelaria rigidula]
EKLELVKEYKRKIEQELEGICTGIVTIINEKLLPGSQSSESKVFYHKMEGDYHRYLAEFQHGDEVTQSKDKALQAYQCATTCSMEDMPPTHPIRLGLALNFSVFYFEILNSPERACSLAKQVRLQPRLLV